LREEPEDGTYQPQAIVGVSILKRCVGESLLCFPMPYERMIQQAISQELCPVVEPEFSGFRYIFLRGKNDEQVILKALTYIYEGH